MKFIQREPGVAYLDTWLWLPRSHVSDDQIQKSLLYIGKDMELIEGWREERHHFRVPRNYFRGIKDLSVLPFPVKDCVFRSFPRINIQSHVTMDGRDLSQTFQRESARALLSTYDGILCLRCGAGKTVVALHAAAQLKGPILIIVQDKGLAKQWVKEIEWVLSIPEEDIGRIGGDGAPFDWEKKICIAIVNTLAIRSRDNTLPPAMSRHFKVVIGDETHTLGAPFFNHSIPPFFGRRWGLSATPTREDGFDSLLRYTMGEVVYSYLMPEIIPRVVFKVLPTQLRTNDPEVMEATHDIAGNLHYGKLYDYFGRENPDKRMDFIALEIERAVAQGRQCLVLTHSRSTIAALMDRFPNAGEVHGGVTDEEGRFRAIRTKNPVIAIMRHGKQALDKPELDTLFVCDPFRKEGVLQQVMGRVQRNFVGKKSALVVFFEDRKIKACYKLCNKLRQSLNRWPSYKGGQIPFIVKE